MVVEAQARESIARRHEATASWLAPLLPFHTHQLISYSRLILAAVALLAIYFDPTQPARYSDVAYLVLAGYAVYALAMAAVSSSIGIEPLWPPVHHAADILVFALLMYLTVGPTSPFFVFFTFAIVSGALRWGAVGAVATAAILLVIFLGVSLRDLGTSDEPDFNRVIIRSAYLLVASMMLGYFGAYRQNSRDRLARLAAWPQPEHEATDRPALEASLRHAALVLQVRSILVVWENADSVWNVAHWSDGRCDTGRLELPEGEAVVAPSLAGRSFMAKDPFGKAAGTTTGSMGVTPPLLSPYLARSFDIGWFATAAFETAHSSGRVFILGPILLNTDLLSLTEIVASRIGFEFEHFWLRSDLALAATTRERARLARDVHDSILQDLTAAGLQLKVMSDRASAEVQPAYGEVIRLVSAQQRRLREFVIAMNPKPGLQPPIAIADVMERTAAELARQWRRRVVWEVRPEDATLNAAQALQLQLLLAEAVANAVRHGEAGEVDVTIDVHDTLRIDIRDDGTGRLGGMEEGAAPFSLTQRVEELGGTCRLAVAETGALLSIELPTE